MLILRLGYHCGSNSGWSSIYSFKTIPDGSDWSPQLAVFGDMGNYNAISLPALQLETQMGMYDAILHVGDFAYDFHTVFIFAISNLRSRFTSHIHFDLY